MQSPTHDSTGPQAASWLHNKAQVSAVPSAEVQPKNSPVSECGRLHSCQPAACSCTCRPRVCCEDLVIDQGRQALALLTCTQVRISTSYVKPPPHNMRMLKNACILNGWPGCGCLYRCMQLPIGCIKPMHAKSVTALGGPPMQQVMTRSQGGFKVLSRRFKGLSNGAIQRARLVCGAGR